MRMTKLVLVMLFNIVIASCGGGGGGGSTPPPATYNISGAVSGATLAGVSISLTGAATTSGTTDAGGSLPHGLAGAEMVELTKAGLSNVEVLSAATWGARQWLGRPGLVEGADADLVVLRSGPRDDVAAVKDPCGIVLRGHVVL